MEGAGQAQGLPVGTLPGARIRRRPTEPETLVTLVQLHVQSGVLGDNFGGQG